MLNLIVMSYVIIRVDKTAELFILNLGIGIDFKLLHHVTDLFNFDITSISLES